MVETKDVLGELFTRTQNGQLKWRAYDDKSGWGLNHKECLFQVPTDTLHLNVVWDFKGKRRSVVIGNREEVQPLVALLQKKFPFVEPPTPTLGEALQAAMHCLTER